MERYGTVFIRLVEVAQYRIFWLRSDHDPVVYAQYVFVQRTPSGNGRSPGALCRARRTQRIPSGLLRVIRRFSCLHAARLRLKATLLFFGAYEQEQMNNAPPEQAKKIVALNVRMTLYMAWLQSGAIDIITVQPEDFST